MCWELVHANDQVKAAQDNPSYQKQLEAGNPIALVLKEYIESVNKELGTRRP